MNCYFCAQRRPGGTSFGNRSAIGICQECGVGVCLEHGQKESLSGGSLLCVDCIKIVNATPKKVADPHVSLN